MPYVKDLKDTKAVRRLATRNATIAARGRFNDAKSANKLLDDVHQGAPGSHVVLYNWHARTFFPYHKHLSSAERRYVRACLDINHEPRYRHFSQFTYSHRVKGGRINSSRIAFGSLRSFDKLRPLFDVVLRRRGIRSVPYLDHDFAAGPYGPFGLGWDLEDDLFKVYFALHDCLDLQKDGLLGLYNRFKMPLDKDLLASHTYCGNKLVEKKIYLYPTQGSGLDLLPPTLPFADLVKRVALMVSDARGLEMQLDLLPRQYSEVSMYVSPAARRCIEAYRTVGGSIDTITWASTDDVTLYFP
jgi:hypothetical protein